MRSWTILTVLFLLVVNSQAFAAASSWSDRPSWAATEATRASARKTPYVRDLIGDISPFAPGSNNLSLDIGQVFLMGDLSGNYSDSIGSQLHYTYGVSDMFGFDARLGHSSHSDGKYSMTSLLTGLRTNLSWYDKVIPHLDFGLGFYRPSREISPTNSVSSVVFGLHMGPGVDLELTKQLFFGASLTFHDMFGTTKLTAAGPMDFGGTYTTFFLRGGVTF